MIRSYHICNNELQTLQICVIMIYKRYLGPLQNLMRKFSAFAVQRKFTLFNIGGFFSPFQYLVD